MSSTTVDVRDNRDLRRVEAVLEDGDVAGFSEYKIAVDGTFEFLHTQVDDRFAGQGIGTQLVTGVMGFLRENDARIRPECEFIRDYMREHKDTQDLLAEGASLDDERADAGGEPKDDIDESGPTEDDKPAAGS